MVSVHAPRYTNVGRILEKGYEHMFCKDASGKGSDKGYMIAIGTCEHTFICQVDTNVSSHTQGFAWSMANVCSNSCFYSDFVVEL